MKVFGIEKTHFVYDKKLCLHREEMREVLSVYLQENTALNALNQLYANESHNGHKPCWSGLHSFDTATFTEMGVEGVSFEFKLIELPLEKTF